MARLLMKAAALAGHEVSLASRLRTWEGEGDEQRQRRIRGIGEKLGAHLIRRYESLAPEKRPEVWMTYHVYHKAPDWLGPAVTSALHIPYVIVEPSVSDRQADGPWRAGHHATLAALAQADAILAMSEKDHAGLAAIATKPGALSLFPPSIETTSLTAARASRQSHRQSLARRCAIDAGVPWLIAAAMMRNGDKLRSYQALARSLMMVRDVAWILLIAGDGPARTDVVESFAGFESGRVHFLGALEPDSLAGAYAAADLCLWPAIHEAYGMALLEAQAAGCPVVAGRYGGVPDIVADGRTGLVVPASDDVQFAEAVRLLLADTKRRIAMGGEAAQHVEAHHSLSPASRRLHQALSRAAGR